MEHPQSKIHGGATLDIGKKMGTTLTTVHIAPLAQLVERGAYDVQATGSSPVGCLLIPIGCKCTDVEPFSLFEVTFFPYSFPILLFSLRYDKLGR